MKYKITFYLLLLSPLYLQINSQHLEKALLWKVSGNGLEKPSYIFGTLHTICEDEIDQSVFNILKNTEQLYLEVDLSAPDNDEQMSENQNMKDGETLQTLLSKKDYELIDQYFIHNKGRSVTLHNHIKPEFVNMMLGSNLQSCKTVSYEEELTVIFKSENKNIYGLESITDQMLIFDTIPYNIQVENLLANVKDDRSNIRHKLIKLKEMYKAKDIEGIENSIRASDNKTYSQYADVILTNRNRKWIKKIEPAIKSNSSFIAVGVTHLAGKDGLIMLLRKKGYTVEAVK